MLLPTPLVGLIDMAMPAARGRRARMFDSAAIRTMGDWPRA